MQFLAGRRTTIALAAIVMFAASCGEHEASVVSPTLRAPRRAPSFTLGPGQTSWDFVALAGGDGAQGQSKTFTIAGAGSIVASAGPAAFPNQVQVNSKGFGLPAGAEERGLGLCRQFEPGPNDCYGASDGEIGDPFGDISPSLFLDFTHLTAGSIVQSVTLASLQPGEGYLVKTSTDGLTYTLVETGQADGSSKYEPTYNLPVPPTTKFLQISPGPGTAGNNYLVQSVTTVTAVCTDPLASNFGGALPCVYPPTPCPGGTFSYTFLQNGDLFIRYDQFPAPNDNSYGVNAVGWPNGHKFSDLVGSDHAGFQLVDGTNTVKLSFNVDYISALSTAPSGYASLGVTGGDGKMIVGTATGITATSSLANNLNNINIPGLFNASHVQQFGSVNLFTDSPPTDASHQTYNISDPLLAGWDFHDTYFVTISAAKLASIGFDPNTWKVEPNLDQLHNSPAKPCPVVGGACNLSATKYVVKDKQVQITIANNASTDAILTELKLNWPSAVNGKLMQVKLDGDIVYDNPDIAGGSADLTVAQLVADQNKRKINHGTSDVLTLVFEKNADTDLTHYTSDLLFGTCPLAILPH